MSNTEDKTECVVEYHNAVKPGLPKRRISKSPHEYLRLKAVRDGYDFNVGLFSNMAHRYGEKTTPTTRRTDYDHEARKQY